MMIQFIYSKKREKEKLLHIHSEYQWFVDNNFPIVLPKFYKKLYQTTKGNKKLFKKELDKRLDNIYDKNVYKKRKEIIRKNWKRNEKEFFNILRNFNVKIKDKYICYITLYGPQGQFEYPNIIDLRSNKKIDIEEADITIAHELMHLILFDKFKKLGLNYKKTEGVIDMFFLETKLKTIFSGYKLQSIAVHDKRLFKEVKDSPK
ncbi:hypothetical protein KAU51_00825 [Candidatus Parcubacteria bacterium]|nr:hypothetical protein [Candidatus Parcubacteria bacterium]